MAVVDPNKQLIQEISKSVPIFKEKVDVTIKEFNNYLENFKDEKFVEIPKEREEDAIKRAESIYDKVDEIVQRRKVVMKNVKETINFIDDIKWKLKTLEKICESKETVGEKTNDDLIDKIIELKQRKLKKEIEQIQHSISPLTAQIEKLKKEYSANQEKLIEDKFTKEENKSMREEKGNIKKFILKKEIKQLEGWTGMKLRKIVFDSKKNNWSRGTIQFDQVIIKERNLLFLIEDGNDSIFGGYVNAKIDKWDSYIKDPRSFVFSLRLNGKLNEMKKFDIKDPQYAFNLCNQSDDCLFRFGYKQVGYDYNDICIYKAEKKSYCCCREISFNHSGNSLRGSTSTFTPTRIIVIQLV